MGSSRNTEVQLQFLKSRLLDETKKHLKKEYDENGRAKEKNITPEEIKGLKVARDITEDGTVIIRPTTRPANTALIPVRIMQTRWMSTSRMTS